MINQDDVTALSSTTLEVTWPKDAKGLSVSGELTFKLGSNDTTQEVVHAVKDAGVSVVFMDVVRLTQHVLNETAVTRHSL